MPAADVLGPDCGAYPDAVAETDAGSVTITYTRTDARTNHRNARAHATTVRGPDARALVATDNRSPFVKTDASAVLVIIVLGRQDYGCYRLR